LGYASYSSEREEEFPYDEFIHCCLPKYRKMSMISQKPSRSGNAIGNVHVFKDHGDARKRS